MSDLRKLLQICLSISLFFALTACSNPERQSQALYETAQFEEQQMNFKHAKQLYQEILRDFPNTSSAAKAKDRLAEIDVTPSP